MSLRVAILGCGTVAEKHAAGYLACDGVELVACADRDQAVAMRFRERFGIPRVYEDYAGLLEKESPDAVSVCTPVHEHAYCSLRALDAGAHVICAAPVAPSAEIARDLVDAVRVRKPLFTVSHPQRFHPAVRYLRRRLEAGALGRVYLARCTALQKPPQQAGVAGANPGAKNLPDMEMCALDLALWLMGNPAPESVFGNIFDLHAMREQIATAGVPPSGETPVGEHRICGFVRMQDGVSLMIDMGSDTSIAVAESYSQVLFGEEGCAVLNPFGCIQPAVRIVFREPETLVESIPEGFEETDPATVEIRHWVSCLRGGAEPVVRLSQCVDVLSIRDGLFLSSQRGHEVALGMPESAGREGEG
jgi:predicted dehydrogenase